METIDQVLVQGYRGWVARAALVLRRWYGIINNPISMRIVALLLLLALALANTCGGCCPSNLCPGCPCGTKTNVVDIPTWCAKHNWSQTCCKCIVVHESAGDANGQDYNTDKTYDIGLWQINQLNWACNAGKPPCDLTANLACAVKIYTTAGGSWKDWSTAKGCGC